MFSTAHSVWFISDFWKVQWKDTATALDTKDVIIEQEQICTLCPLSICASYPLSFSSVILSSILFSCPGSKAAPRPGGIGSAAAGQPGIEGDSMLSKILPGGAAEQAGKLGEGTTNKSLESSSFQTSDLMKDLPWKNISYYYRLSPC